MAKRFEDYTGDKKWIVSHPDFKDVTVHAPDTTAALVAACKVWGVKWTQYSIYAFATVTRA